jgi:hypothetical protein
MSERTTYPPGVPCWVDAVAPAGASTQFYEALFGWDFVGPGGASGDYLVAQLRGRDVAGVRSQPPEGATGGPAWTTYIAVDTVAGAVEHVTGAGGAILAGPIDAAPAGRLAIVADPAGAVFGVWEAGLRDGAQLVNEPSAWSMSSLNTGDAAGAQSFYAEVFDWQFEPFGPDASGAALCRLAGYVGGEPAQPVPRDVVAVMLPLSDGGGPHWSVDFWIDDADAAAAKVPELGGRIVVSPHDQNGFRSGVLADPAGAVFSVSTLVAGP